MIDENFRVLSLQMAQKFFTDNNLGYTFAELTAKANEFYSYIITGQ